ncbi:type II toxin-antitoxin system CcdA family antitoxin [Infirmifilum sp. NZ]|uniref:type II toxin-antitoxin system CcdA family antitoxin n=1 Tax=Infirmifilum sp. NZ TaxID=2926850 RepID=UPI0027A0E56D|nr:type II toxin-antitoxin system CcdA family antitoxin [Infirmifilum sp. NZ]UNQ73592.1 type II toxin-antitoxin system CcdA family antitoxin [Infirmifilum sp. NZ]
MGRYITVSTKVRRELLEEARRLGINVSELLRRALEEVRRRRLMSLEKSLREMRRVLDKIDVGEVVDLIREDRETR